MSRMSPRDLESGGATPKAVLEPYLQGLLIIIEPNLIVGIFRH